jgi:hypothetical protein
VDKVNISLDKKLFDLGIEYFHSLNLNTSSWLLAGASGSGKSVCGMNLINNIVSCVPDSRIWICDGKHDDYKFLGDIENSRYWGYLDMAVGVDNFYNMFSDRLTGQCNNRTHEIIVLEEWSSVLRMLEADKATTPKAKKMLSQAFSITSQGRAYGVHALFILQKPSMDFLSGFRENLTSVISLGRLSPEVAKMCGFGVGWFLNDKNRLFQVKIPHFEANDFARFKKNIIKGTTR